MNPSIELLQKYSKAGPRYTSYPTAPYFHESFDEAAWRAELAASQDVTRPLSLYYHIPFCDTLCYYCGCNMIATGHYEKVSPYLDSLEAEMDAVAALTDPARVVRQLHWGGGTPTYLKPEDIGRLMGAIRRRFTIADDAELGCEADPRELTRDHVAALREAGFNRLSFGVQDLDEKVQKATNRIHPAPMVEQAFRWGRELGFSSINMDLIVGLPHQNVESFAGTLEQLLAWAPDRFAIFGYAHVPWMKKHQSLINEADLPDFATRLALQDLIHQRLTAAGYVNIGLDHYAKPEDDMVKAQNSKTLWRNFQGYTTHKNCDMLGFGASSIGQTRNTYVQNHKKLRVYQESVAATGMAVERGLRLTRDDEIRRDAITRVMCDLELDAAAFSAEWGVNCWEYFADALPELEAQAADGFMTLDGGTLKVTELGRRFLRNIAMTFDYYLRHDIAPQGAVIRPRYSKTA